MEAAEEEKSGGEPICIKSWLPVRDCGHCRRSPEYESMPVIAFARNPREPMAPDVMRLRRETAFTPCSCSGCGRVIHTKEDIWIAPDRYPFCTECYERGLLDEGD